MQTQPIDNPLGSNPIQTKPNVSFNPAQTVCIHLYDTLDRDGVFYLGHHRPRADPS
jgi:hypothetical protein